MRFRKNVPAEHREFLQELLKQYKKEMTMMKDELRELEKWVASGRSPYDNGDYIYSENGCPMDFVSAMRFQDEMYEWWMSLSEEEREQEFAGLVDKIRAMQVAGNKISTTSKKPRKTSTGK